MPALPAGVWILVGPGGARVSEAASGRGPCTPPQVALAPTAKEATGLGERKGLARNEGVPPSGDREGKSLPALPSSPGPQTGPWYVDCLGGTD